MLVVKVSGPRTPVGKRKRKKDIPALIRHFVERKCLRLGISPPPKIDPSTFDELLSYQWPGNVRELENMVERALLRRQGNTTGAGLNFEISGFSPVVTKENEMQNSQEEIQNLAEVIRTHIQKTLKFTRNRVEGPDGAAELLGLHPSTLRSKMRKMEIPHGRRR